MSMSLIGTNWNGFDIESMTVFQGDTYNAYAYTSPDATPGIAYEGGWNQQSDIGPDILYQAPVNTQELSPIIWDTPSPSLQYHVNDPTIIRPESTDGQDRSNWVYMYFTQLGNQFTTFQDITTHNEIGFAASFNNGMSWTYLGKETDGWAPSAIQLNDKIDVFYHTNGAPVVQMQQFDQDGWVRPQTPVTLMNTATGKPLEAVNVSVTQYQDKLLLTGNGIGSIAFGDIVAYTAASNDPTHWTPLLNGDPVLVHGGSVMLLTPEGKFTSPNQVEVTFTMNPALDSHGVPTGAPQSTTTMKWDLTLK